MFAFAIWDAREQRLLLARDPLGQKPLYYIHREGELTFASEIKALLAGTGHPPRMNVRALHHYISLRCVPGSDTLFEGINKLPAGHLMLLERGRLTVQPYWELRYTPKWDMPEEELIARLRQLLMDTVARHMLSDAPLGAFLSGGLDSSLIVALMSTLSDAPIQTFSVGSRDQDFNELPYARLMARRYGTDHHELIVEPDLVLTLPEMIRPMEEPVDPFAFGVYSVARLASRHVKVALGGDGGDEIFAGYDRYLGNQLVDLYCLLPAPLRRHVIEPLIRRLPDNHAYNNPVQRLRWLVAMSATEAGERYAQSACFLRFGHAHKRALYTEALWRELGGYDSSALLLQYFDADPARHPLDKMLYTDVKTRLAEHLLMVVDRMTMAHSLEGRSPYVDQRLVAFAARLPAELKLRGRRLRYIQRQLAREFLPRPLLRRRKQGFGFPLARWFKTELRELMHALFRDSHLAAGGYFRPEAIRALLEEHIDGRADHNYRLWLLLNLELWHRLFIEGSSPAAQREWLTRFLPEATAAPSPMAFDGYLPERGYEL